MSRSVQEEVFDPFSELTNGLSLKQLGDIHRAECWAYYLNGGGGNPFYFDYEGYLKMLPPARER